MAAFVWIAVGILYVLALRYANDSRDGRDWKRRPVETRSARDTPAA